MTTSHPIKKAGKKDREQIISLLKESDLPVEDLSFESMDFYVVREDERVIAVGAIERSGDYALFRSLAVHESYRGLGLAKRMTSHLIRVALNKNTRDIFLLTETAVSFFQRLGFEEIHRETVPESIKATSEYSEQCPSTAIVLKLKK